MKFHENFEMFNLHWKQMFRNARDFLLIFIIGLWKVGTVILYSVNIIDKEVNVITLLRKCTKV